MSCHICETIQRDLQDVLRVLEKRTADQMTAAPDRMAALDLELRALTATKAEIESKYWKHRKSTSH